MTETQNTKPIVDIILDNPFIKMLRRNRFYCRLSAHFGYFFLFILRIGKEDIEAIDKWITIYRMDTLKKSQLRQLRLDILYSVIRFGIQPGDYFFYDFMHASDEGRKEYIGSFRWIRLHRRLKNLKARSIFGNKYQSYLKFKPYYMRDIIQIKGVDDRDSFLDFCSKHKRFMVKPQEGSQGDGIMIIDIADYDSLEALFQELLPIGECVVEELIVQTDEMAKFHPQSVNTVRAVTIYHEEKVHLLYTALRIGVGDSVVDNLGAGGMCVAVDTESGVISSRAFGKNPDGGVLFHPQTGVQLLGARLPDWEQLLSLVQELPKVVPYQKIVGWDLAHTEKGWVMLEGNSTPQIGAGQMTSGSGLAKKVESIIGEF